MKDKQSIHEKTSRNPAFTPGANPAIMNENELIQEDIVC